MLNAYRKRLLESASSPTNTNRSRNSNSNSIENNSSTIPNTVITTSTSIMDAAKAAEAHRRMQAQDAEIESLKDRVLSLTQQLETSLLNSAEKRRQHPLSPHQFNVREVRMSNNKRTIIAQRQRIGRTASLATRQVLEKLAIQQQQHENKHQDHHPCVQRIFDMFERPTQHMDYLNSNVFAKDLLKLCSKARHLLEREPRVVFLQSPAYVFGDIHGNLEDLHFFSDNIWRLGMSLTAGNFLFLGDYVDRGLSCLETVAYLLAVKTQLPNKVFLLRGNHETRDVNGWEEHYGERSFIWQCRNRFGDDLGYRLWEACNQVFDRLPLAAVIDQEIFCVHGGIPRPIHENSTRIQDILAVPKVAGINPPYEHEQDEYQQVASDCIWSDPASEEQEMTSVDPETGYGESLRGGGAICFGNKAVTDFLQQQDFSYIMRAHEAHAEGVAVSKGARVFTVFSTSQDHNQGAHAMAGCILVDNDKLQVINRSPAYRNQYVHRRDSVSLSTLSEKEIQQRIKLGLVTTTSNDPGLNGDDDEDEEDDLEWEDFDIDSDDAAEQQDNGSNKTSSKNGNKQEHEYVLTHSRRSSVDLASMSSNSHDETDWESDQSTVDQIHQFEPNKRHRSTSLITTAIGTIEEVDEEEVATVNGEEEVEEMES